MIARLVGHARKGTTALYSHLFPEAFDGVEAALAATFDPNAVQTEGANTGRLPSPTAAKAPAAMRS